MGEVGIDIQHAVSKSLTTFLGQEYEFVITVCDDAAKTCPVFPGPSARIHWPFEDPAKFIGSEEEVREAFRRTRDHIRLRIEELLSEDSRFNLKNTQSTR
jgi:arsenate reductase